MGKAYIVDTIETNNEYKVLMAPIIAKFSRRLQLRLAAYEGFSAHLNQSGLSRGLLETVKMDVHKISGSAKTLGFEKLGISAAKTEKAIEEILEFEESRMATRNLAPIFSEFLKSVKEIVSLNVDNGVQNDFAAVLSTNENPEYHVLIVDDDVFARDLVKLVLNNMNCKISEASTGKAALDFLDKNTPDLIVLDVNLPDISGFDILSKMAVLEKRNSMRIAMFTREKDVDSYIVGISRGANEYIKKPISIELLEKELIRILKFNGYQEKTEQKFDQVKYLMMSIKKDQYY